MKVNRQIRPDDLEVRTAEIRVAADEDNPRRMVGYAALFDTPTTIGDQFREQIAAGAFARSVDDPDVRALFDHDAGQVLGRVGAGTLKLAEDDNGLRVEIIPPNTQLGRDLAVLMERGDVNQMSFGFYVVGQRWEDEKGELPLRTITDVELLEVSVVTFPAYPTTEIGLRDMRAASRPDLTRRVSLLRRRLRLLNAAPTA